MKGDYYLIIQTTFETFLFENWILIALAENIRICTLVQRPSFNISSIVFLYF